MAASVGAPSPQSAHGSWPRLSIPAEDMIDFFKVVSCPQTSNHNWSTCFYAHPNEKARRRSLAEHPCSAIFCVDMLSKGECKKGDECNLAHSVFEYWMHPEKFRTKFCKDGPDCKRAVCFFAHNRQELRNPSSDYQARSLTGNCSQHLQQLAHAINNSSITDQSSRCPIGDPGSRSSSNTLLYPSAISGHHALTGATSVQRNRSHSGMQADTQSAAANLQVLMMNNVAGSGMPASSRQDARRIMMVPQQDGRSSMPAAIPLQGILQFPGTDTDSTHAAHIAALQLQYDERVHQAELAAARVEATSSTLQAVVAALGRSASSGTALNSPPISGVYPADWPAEQDTRTAAAHDGAGELAAMPGVPYQHQLGVADAGQYQQSLVPLVDVSGSISFVSPRRAHAANIYAMHSGHHAGADQVVSFDLPSTGLSQHVSLPRGAHVMKSGTAAAAATNVSLEEYSGSEGMVKLIYGLPST